MLASVTHNAIQMSLRWRPDFESVVRGELAVLYRVARRMVRSDDDASDLVQQTVVKAYAAYDRFDGRHMRSWLIRIMRNENLMRLRTESRVEHTELQEDVATETPFWEEVLWRAQASQILEILDGLPEEYKMAVTLCDLEEMSYEEAAAAMDTPIGTVRSRLFRGRKLIRERMEEGAR